MSHDDEQTFGDPTGAMQRLDRAVMVERIDKLEHDVQTLLIGFSLLSLSLFFLVRELYASPAEVPK